MSVSGPMSALTSKQFLTKCLNMLSVPVIRSRWATDPVLSATMIVGLN